MAVAAPAGTVNQATSHCHLVVTRTTVKVGPGHSSRRGCRGESPATGGRVTLATTRCRSRTRSLNLTHDGTRAGQPGLIIADMLHLLAAWPGTGSFRPRHPGPGRRDWRLETDLLNQWDHRRSTESESPVSGSGSLAQPRLLGERTPAERPGARGRLGNPTRCR
jgi:hypothetical protein